MVTDQQVKNYIECFAYISTSLSKTIMHDTTNEYQGVASTEFPREPGGDDGSMGWRNIVRKASETEVVQQSLFRGDGDEILNRTYIAYIMKVFVSEIHYNTCSNYYEHEVNISRMP